MIWAIRAVPGVPLWLCVFGIVVTVLNNRTAQTLWRHPGPSEAPREEAMDAWACRLGVRRLRMEGSPADWNEDLFHVVGVTLRNPDPEELKKLHRLGDGFRIATRGHAIRRTTPLAMATID